MTLHRRCGDVVLTSCAAGYLFIVCWINPQNCKSQPFRPCKSNQTHMQTVYIQMRRLVTSRLIGIYTVCHSVFVFYLIPLFAAMDMSKFKDGRVIFRNLGMKGLIILPEAWKIIESKKIIIITRYWVIFTHHHNDSNIYKSACLLSDGNEISWLNGKQCYPRDLCVCIIFSCLSFRIFWVSTLIPAGTQCLNNVDLTLIQRWIDVSTLCACWEWLKL